MNRRRRAVRNHRRGLFPELTALLLVALAAPAGAQLQLLGYQWLNQNVSGVDGAAELGDLFGSSLAAGDFNCDGYDDLAVGVPHEDEDGVTRSGAVNVFYGGPAGLTGGELWSQADSGVPSSNEPFDQFGEVLEAFYRNRDAYMCDSLAVGAPNEAANGEDIDDAGAVWIFRGTASGLVPDGILVQGQDGAPESAEAGDRFGASISQGPLTGDPNDCTPVETPTSLLIGAPGEGLGLFDNGDGAVIRITMPCILEGSSVGNLPSFVRCDLFQEEPCRAFTADDFDLPVDLDPYDGFGGSLAFLRHDADAGWDGGDPIVGVPDANEAGGSASIGAFLESERNWAAVGSQYWTQDSSGVQQVAEASDHFAEVLEEGDFDGDGDEDLAIGVPRENGGADIDVGVVHALYSTGTAPSKELTATGDFIAAQGDLAGEATEADDEFGGALAAGDFDGDGVEDLAVGVPGEDLSSPRVVADAGAVNLLYGVAGSGLATSGAQQFDGDDLFFNGANASGYFGSALAAGDFDGNGIDDLAIGEPGDSTLDNSWGFVAVLYGAQNGILGYVSFAVADPSQAESVGSIEVDLARTGSAVTSVNATVRVKPGDGGTATAGVDYNFTSAQAHWDAGETGVQSVFVPIVNDSESEPAETIVLEISATSSGLAEQSPSEVVLQIDASDAPAFELQLGALSTLESVGNLPLLVIRSGATYPAASVSWTTVSGSGLFGAVAGQDFTASGSTLTWSAGETGGKWIQIPVANDSTPEADEIFVVTLYGPSGAGLSSPAATVVTILANDGAIFFEDFETGSTARWSVPWP